MEMGVEIPLDADGYVRRQCPHCERAFKWHHTPADGTGVTTDREPAEEYFCPYCGEPAPLDQWYTDEQIDYIRAVAGQEALKNVVRELGASIRAMNRQRGVVQMSVQPQPSDPPPPLFEPDDMVAIEPPCHPDEPVKVAEGSPGPFHCLICGTLFSVED